MNCLININSLCIISNILINFLFIFLRKINKKLIIQLNSVLMDIVINQVLKNQIIKMSVDNAPKRIIYESKRPSAVLSVEFVPMARIDDSLRPLALTSVDNAPEAKMPILERKHAIVDEPQNTPLGNITKISGLLLNLLVHKFRTSEVNSPEFKIIFEEKTHYPKIMIHKYYHGEATQYVVFNENHCMVTYILSDDSKFKLIRNLNELICNVAEFLEIEKNKLNLYRFDEGSYLQAYSNNTTFTNEEYLIIVEKIDLRIQYEILPIL